LRIRLRLVSSSGDLHSLSNNDAGIIAVGPLRGNLGTGAFDSDDALDLLDTLTEQDEDRRRQTLERIFRGRGAPWRPEQVPRPR